MGSTAGGLAFPDAADPVDVAGDIEALANSIKAGTAWVTSTTGFAGGTGWTLTAVRYRRMGPLVWLRILVTRSGSAITVGAGSGDITNVVVATVPASLYPTQTIGMGQSAAGRVAAGFLDTSGNVTLNAVAGDGTNIATSDTIDLECFYPLG